MYQSISRCDFHDAFRNMDRKENFSYEARNALFDYLEEYEDSTGEKIELDVIALCCEYNEEDIQDVLNNYELDSLDELKDNTQVIWHNNTVVLYQVF